MSVDRAAIAGASDGDVMRVEVTGGTTVEAMVRDVIDDKGLAVLASPYLEEKLELRSYLDGLVLYRGHAHEVGSEILGDIVGVAVDAADPDPEAIQEALRGLDPGEDVVVRVVVTSGAGTLADTILHEYRGTVVASQEHGDDEQGTVTVDLDDLNGAVAVNLTQQWAYGTVDAPRAVVDRPGDEAPMHADVIGIEPV